MSADDESAIADKLDALSILNPVKEADALLQNAKTRRATITDWRAEGGVNALEEDSRKRHKCSKENLWGSG